MVKLFSAVAADGSSSFIRWGRNPGAFQASGTWDGATVTLQLSADGANWVAVGSDTTLTADGAAGFSVPPSTWLRATVSNAGAGTSLSAWVW